MTKKILFSLVAVVAVVGGVAAMSAYEAHIINVTAKIENALNVSTKHIEFGTVFPQEKLSSSELTIGLSQSFIDEDRVDDVDYVIKYKPKVKGDPFAIIPGTEMVAHEYCLTEEPDNPSNPEDPYYTYCYPYLCDRIKVTANEEEEPGHLAKSEQDLFDGYTVDLAVPCFEGMCDQGYDPQVYGDPLPATLEHEIFGCDIWVEVNGISKKIPIYEELGDETPKLGPIEGYFTYDGVGTGALTGTLDIEDGYLTNRLPNGSFILVLNGPRNASVAPGSTNDLLAEYACTQPNPGLSEGWDGWWTRQTDNTGATECTLSPGAVKLEGYYNFEFGVTAAELEAGYSFSLPLPAGTYSEVQFLIKDENSGWATVLEYPGVGESDSMPSEFSFTIN